LKAKTGQMSKIKALWLKFKSRFVSLQKLTVSYNYTWGDGDDQVFIVKKFFITKDNYIKFRTEDNKIVELRGSTGLNYRIEDV